MTPVLCRGKLDVEAMVRLGSMLKIANDDIFELVYVVKKTEVRALVDEAEQAMDNLRHRMGDDLALERLVGANNSLLEVARRFGQKTG